MGKGGINSNKAKIWTWVMGTVCIIVLLVCFVIIVMPGEAARSYFGDSGNGNSTASNGKREALPPGSVNETAYFTEHYYLDDPIVIEEGLKHFYELTGVQPYVQIITSYNGDYHTKGPHITQDLDFYRDLVAYARACYSQLFTDESHLLLMFLDVDSFGYTMAHHDICIVTGSKAKTVIDPEAEEILSAYIERYFEESGRPSEEMFSKAFSDAGDRIMGVAPPQSDITVFIILGALALIVLLVRLRSIKKKRKLKEQQNKEILGMPLEHYGADTGAKAFKRQAAQGNAAPDGAGYDTLPKDEAEILAEKYAARSNKASVNKGHNTRPAGGKSAHGKPASVSDGNGEMKKDMGL